MILKIIFLITIWSLTSATHVDNKVKIDKYYAELQNSSTCLSLFKTTETSIACLIEISLSFDDANAYCQSLNMTLLEINQNDDNLKEMVFNETEKIFGLGKGSTIFINGKKSKENGTWIAEPNPRIIEFIKEKHKSNNDEITLPSEDYYDDEYELCLVIKSFYKERKYEIDSYGCNHKCYFYCEFNSFNLNDI
ncbi:hypothetical protein PVAND_009679 [Polypedilum vanderplanki]|uniref:C-type lectin domain-containing protein n=1 Tax=Polypedilum vanderplanki TaxID=319348 RepID=A0A9J6CDL2_POLVA|nr:hypothetical protein PVAND_009679 [Polypedilum vanderplanki]